MFYAARPCAVCQNSQISLFSMGMILIVSFTHVFLCHWVFIALHFKTMLSLLFITASVQQILGQNPKLYLRVQILNYYADLLCSPFELISAWSQIVKQVGLWEDYANQVGRCVVCIFGSSIQNSLKTKPAIYLGSMDILLACTSHAPESWGQDGESRWVSPLLWGCSNWHIWL